MIRDLFDQILALVGIVLLLPLFIIIPVWIVLDSRGGAFYIQKRIGKGGKPFGLIKFRTMRPASDQKGKLTVGNRDPRITPAGYVLRKYKLDELPQLFNVLKGEMRFVGPRPEVEEYVRLYTSKQRRVLSVKPGITDYASLKYFEESELLAKSDNPRQTYIDEIMPEKININLEYLRRKSFSEDLRIILKTIGRIFS